uniref:Uncharacterized protein n=1 Tax=Arundo donax TaxID=35708 RepID=A0A0A9HND6_ARUDO
MLGCWTLDLPHYFLFLHVLLPSSLEVFLFSSFLLLLPLSCLFLLQ